MNEVNYLIRENGTQRVFLTEGTLNVLDILNEHYGYIFHAIEEEGIILKASECSLFKELVFENKVVGFCSYDFSREFITAALNNIYVMPQFRGNGLFFDEILNTMAEHNKPSIIEPTRLVVELLIRYGFAKKINDDIVASSIEFIVPGSHVLANAPYDLSEELSTHFYDLKMCASIHFLDIDNGIIAYSQPLNYDIIHYDCLDFRNQANDESLKELKDVFLSNEIEIMEILMELEENIPVKTYSLDEIVGEGDEFSPYIESLIDDAHVTRQKAFSIKRQLIEEYEAGMVLNESLLVRLAYLFEGKTEPTIKSHSETCPYCGMPIDSHDRFCHFCGINLEYNPDEMLDSLMDSINHGEDDFAEDIRFISYKFLNLILQGIEEKYSIFTIENTYNIDWSSLKGYLEAKGYFSDGKITAKGYEFLDSHPLAIYDEYCLNMVDYTDFEKYCYENENLNKKEMVLNYLRQFGDEFSDMIDEIEDN
ncbi:hypothetical protein [Methanobrevibacter sp.]|uniref:hypothetical protein n=1 Tax=Methanobrevibacter sp. TaxID=66852 RepID=UPI00389089E1